MRHSIERVTPVRPKKGATELRVLIAEPHAPLRETIRRLLQLHEACSSVGEAKSGEEVLARVGKLRPDLVILDLSLPGALGTLADLAARFPWAKVAVLLSDYNEEYRAAARARGAFSCIDKRHLEEHLAWAIARLQGSYVRQNRTRPSGFA